MLKTSIMIKQLIKSNFDKPSISIWYWGRKSCQELSPNAVTSDLEDMWSMTYISYYHRKYMFIIFPSGGIKNPRR